MGARILVADDSVTIQKVVELTFTKEDFTLTQARSGEEAIRRAKEVRPDLVLLDLVMPDMNGYDVCAALRAEPALRSVPVILLAGTFEAFDEQRGARVGANDFVTKPFESQVLLGKVKQLLFAKAMEADRAAASVRPSGDAVTVKIPPAQAGPSAGAPQSGASAALQAATPVRPVGIPSREVFPPLERPPLPVGASPLEPPPSGTSETLDLERLPAEPETPALDLGAIELEPLPAPSESVADALDVLPLPESLSLDELLGVEADVIPAGSPEEAAVPGPEPVFELTETDAPPLPMVEAGKGEPPALSVEGLLPVESPTLELPELDLTALSEAPSPPRVDEGSMGSPVADMVAESPEAFTLEPFDDEAPRPGVEEPFAAAASEVALGAELLESGPEPVLSEEALETAPVQREASSFAGAEGATAAASQQRTSDMVAPHDMAAMRDAVTARVAEELRHELSEKLLDRFEKIVWEVVPDLAEILITKEIERIRRMTEEEPQS